MSRSIKTVLIVDDEEALREVIVEILGLLDIDSIEAESGMQALELAQAHKDNIDLFLIDKFMPKMSGEETFAKLNEIIPDRPVIFMSGFGEDAIQISNTSNSPQKFLKKPFGISDLKDLITSFM